MNDKLFAKATAGVYAEVIKQIYDSMDKRIREAVSNAYDAEAKEVKISVFIERDSQIIIYDNGNGMDEDDIREKYITMGGGDNYNNEKTIGRIGIGALAVFALGDEVIIETRKKGSNKIVTARLDLARVKEPTEHATPLERIELGRITGSREVDVEEAEHFTKITILRLSNAALEIFRSEEKTKILIEQLEKILPVPYRSDDKIFDVLPNEIKQKIIQDKYVLNVTFHMPNQEYRNYKIYRKSIYSEPQANIQKIYPIYPYRLEGGYHDNLNIYGYLYINAARALPGWWKGLNVRVKNVTIEKHTYFGYEENQPARDRIGGEIFINNLDENHAIQSNRSGFAVENNDYIIIANYVRKFPIQEAIDIVRKDSEIDSLVKNIVMHLEKLHDMFQRHAAVENEKDDADNFKMLDDINVEVGDFRLYSLETNVKTELDKIGEVCEPIIWTGILVGRPYYIEYEEDGALTIKVHEKLRRLQFDVAGNSIEYVLGYLGKAMPIFVKKPGRVILNLDNELILDKDISKVEIDFIESVVVLYLNFLRSNNIAQVLYENAIRDLNSARNR